MSNEQKKKKKHYVRVRTIGIQIYSISYPLRLSVDQKHKTEISWYIKIRFMVIRDTVGIAVGARAPLFVVTLI